MQDNSIQVFNIPMGPGSQDEGDMVLDYMKMPSQMSTYDFPILPESSAVKACPETLALMSKLEAALAAYQPKQPIAPLVLDALPAAGLTILNQIFGEGEVSIVVKGEVTVRIQETVLAGVWRLRYLDSEGQVYSDTLEVADIPLCVTTQAFIEQRELSPTHEGLPAGVLNAPSVLVEIAEASVRFRNQPATEPHVINLSLLPFSPQDHQYLAMQLGEGGVVMLSRGYGNCRISSTQVAGVWRVQYFNSTDQLILDTLEITDIPAVACAAPEDLADSAERLQEILEVYI